MLDFIAGKRRRESPAQGRVVLVMWMLSCWSAGTVTPRKAVGTECPGEGVSPEAITSLPKGEAEHGLSSMVGCGLDRDFASSQVFSGLNIPVKVEDL